jgi:hypothetical protein
MCLIGSLDCPIAFCVTCCARSCSIAFFVAEGQAANFANEKAQCVTALSEYMLREVQGSLSRGRFDSDLAGLENALACAGNVLHSDAAARQLAVTGGLQDSLGKFLPMMPEGICTQCTRATLALF